VGPSQLVRLDLPNRAWSAWSFSAIEVGILVAADVRCTLALVQDRLRQGDAVVLLEVGEAQLLRQAASLQGLAQRRGGA
jgi:hypothetical protein